MRHAPPPRIDPLLEWTARPFWSVMIPTYNSTDLLECTLRSVLDQDPGPEQMQIAVVDDASPNGHAEQVVASLAASRVEFHRRSINGGLATCWNECVGRARGQWVHLLHQDDLVLPGFYEHLERASADPTVGAAFCQHAFIGPGGEWESISPLERRQAGVIEGWLDRISRGQRLQCPAIVVRRSTYEELGGYCTHLHFVLDWEMWVRIAARYQVWYEPKVLACYRMHEGSETARLRQTGADFADLDLAIAIVADSLPAELRDSAGCELRLAIRQKVFGEVCRRLVAGDHRSGRALLRTVCHVDPALRFSRIHYNYRKWALKLWLVESIGRVVRGAGIS